MTSFSSAFKVESVESQTQTQLQIQSLFETLQEEALPGVWSKGVTWSRTPSLFVVDDWKESSSEWRFRVVLPSGTVHPRVTLWPKDQEWHCNCGDRNDPCSHTVAVVSCIRNGLLKPGSSSSASVTAEAKRSHTVVRYLWKANPKSHELFLTRELLLPNGLRRPLLVSLVSVVGAHQTGRSDTPPIAASKEDFKVDQLLSRAAAASFETARGMPSRFSPSLVHELLHLLSEFGEDSVEFQEEENQPLSRVRCQKNPVHARAKITEGTRGNFRFTWDTDSPSPDSSDQALSIRTFPNGALFQKRGTETTLRPWTDPLQDPSLPSELRQLFQNSATQTAVEIRHSEIESWVTRFIPALARRIELAPLPDSFPKLDLHSEPRIEMQAETLPASTPGASPEVTLTARVVYWNEKLQARTAEWDFQKLTPIREGLIPQRKPELELELSRELFSEYHLKPSVPSKLTQARAVQVLDRFQSRSSRWILPKSDSNKTPHQRRDGFDALRISSRSPLIPKIDWSPSSTKGSVRIEISFHQDTASGPATANVQDVWEAWNRGEPWVPLLKGGFAPIPEEWLRRNRSWMEKFFGDRASGKILSQREHSQIHLPEILSNSSTESASEESTRWVSILRDRLIQYKQWDELQPNSSPIAVLRSYQQEGVRWLLTLRSLEAGALLADDMGLGKTLQCLSAIPDRTLIVCPTSVLYSWRKQIEAFFPNRKVHLHHGPQRFKSEDLKTADWVLTTYGILRTDGEKLRENTKWNALVLDEAQSIKNPESLTAQSVFAFSPHVAWRLALSGTPIENRIEELWSLSQFINPGLLGPLREFVTEAREDFSSTRKKIRPFLLRRLKQEVAKELPPRIEETLVCELTSSEREVYSRVLHSKNLDELETIQILEQLLRLRQSCSDPQLLPAQWTQDLTPGEGSFSESSKTQLLMEQLEVSIEAGHRSLVFSQWTSYLDRIEQALERRKIRFLRIDGSTSDRAKIIDSFQSENGPPVLLLSLKAGGVGLTLTAADHVYLLDPWWNPATEDQAADRAHRIGQTRTVLIRRIIARDSVEEKILELQAAKRELAAALFAKDDSAKEEPGNPLPSQSPSELSRAELLALFK